MHKVEGTVAAEAERIQQEDEAKAKANPSKVLRTASIWVIE